jgi:hypothetical protein
LIPIWVAIVFSDNFAGTSGDEYDSVHNSVWVVLTAAYLKFLAPAGSEHILPIWQIGISIFPWKIR